MLLLQLLQLLAVAVPGALQLPLQFHHPVTHPIVCRIHALQEHTYCQPSRANQQAQRLTRVMHRVWWPYWPLREMLHSMDKVGIYIHLSLS